MIKMVKVLKVLVLVLTWGQLTGNSHDLFLVFSIKCE